MTVAFHTLPRIWQAQSAAAKLLTRIRNRKHIQLDQLPTEMPEVFSSAYRTFQHSSTLEGEGNEGQGRKMRGNEWDFSSPSWDQVRECLLTSACVCAHRGVTEHSCACACVSGCDQWGRICRETPRQTDSWPGRQKNRQRYKWLKWVEIVWTGLYNVFPAEQLLIQFWQTHGACKNTKTWYCKNEHYGRVLSGLLFIKSFQASI